VQNLRTFFDFNGSMQTQFNSGIVWFRRDLRTQDNPALTAALKNCQKVYCIFIFDRAILDLLPHNDRRVEFIRESLVELDANLRAISSNAGAGLIVKHGWPDQDVAQLALATGASVVYAAHDYEPAAIERDAAVENALQQVNVQFITVKDHVIAEKTEVVTQTGKPYTVFTPYLRRWLARLAEVPPSTTTVQGLSSSLAVRPTELQADVPTLESLGFARTNLNQLHIQPGTSGAAELLSDFWNRMDNYGEKRDFPALKGPSYLGVHLRFGTVSIRQLVSLAWHRQSEGSAGAQVWLAELAWRDFYFQILANFPHVTHGAFKPEYDSIQWETGDQAQTLFSAWCQGLTGYPLVDAAMHQLNQTGYMHNRLRMVAGSFLVKHLGLDWRWGERYFAEKLNDFDLAANNGGWQWVSSSGCDAQPYFRIFNPVTQSERFDAEGKFIKRYLPQLKHLDSKSIHAPWTSSTGVLAGANLVLGRDYPHPIVDHATAREKTLERYRIVRKIK
jgi:deoxyribodipyrimidine photo-lyase